MPDTEVNWVIGFLARADDGKPMIVADIPISDKDLASYQDAVKRLRDFCAHQTFRIVVRNLHVLLEYCEECATLGDNPILALRGGDIVREIQRHVLNWLSSVRMFLDHAETRLKRRHGETSSEYLAFESATNKAYDDSFAYLFCYRLRNYAQHCGMPIGRVSMHSRLDESTEEVHSSFSLTFDRDQLLHSFDGWGSLANEIATQPKDFDVLPLIREANDCVQAIYVTIVQLDYREMIRHAETVMRILSPAIAPDQSATLVGAVQAARPDGELELKFDTPPFECIEELLRARSD